MYGNIVELYDNKNGVVKFIHDDSSETCIKTVASCNYIYNPKSKELITNKENRYKYSVFISSSVGCRIGCKMCYLTTKKFPYKTLTSNDIVLNTKCSLKHMLTLYPEIKDKYIKLCYMGMGDAFLSFEKTIHTCFALIAYIKQQNLKGLDGIDIGTVRPSMFKRNASQIIALNDVLNFIAPSTNPFNDYNNRSICRIFYSLHDTRNDKRRSLIPMPKMDIAKDIEALKFINSNGINVILHQLFLDGINDDEENIDNLISICQQNPDFELRILRYNKCDKSTLVESKKFDSIIDYLNDKVPKIKFQISPGSEIKAACGQFLAHVIGK